MIGTFSRCKILYHIGIKNWNVSSVLSTNMMFYLSVIDLDLTN